MVTTIVGCAHLISGAVKNRKIKFGRKISCKMKSDGHRGSSYQTGKLDHIAGGTNQGIQLTKTSY